MAQGFQLRSARPPGQIPCHHHVRPQETSGQVQDSVFWKARDIHAIDEDPFLCAAYGRIDLVALGGSQLNQLIAAKPIGLAPS